MKQGNDSDGNIKKEGDYTSIKYLTHVTRWVTKTITANKNFRSFCIAIAYIARTLLIKNSVPATNALYGRLSERNV
ncbi:Hypothetical protein CINCED_3A008476 [Cinara cedri]|uniref:Uncharacterized protein n=1 Tax=Cinara cedri TaxID=506608 RepID=A0A5E4M7C6_9HEMI|nr:Hypothetical protein CINCED_3A008476 [Cinara cedri]